MPRTSLRDRLQGGNQPAPQGREALYQAHPNTEAVEHPERNDRTRLTVDGGPSTRSEERWDDAHTRVTFYCPIPLLQAIEEEVKSSKRSKSQVIVDALRSHLRGQRSRRG